MGTQAMALHILVSAQNQAGAVFSQLGNGLQNMLFGFRNLGTAGTIGMDAIKQGAVQAGTALWKISAVLAVIGIAAGVYLGTKAVQAAGDFQQAMLLNVSHAGLLRSKMDETGQSILNMATEVGRSPIEMAQALYPILSGFSGIQNQSAKTAISLATLKLSFQAVAGSEASGVDVAHSAISAFNAFGMQTSNQATNLARMKTLFDQMNETVKTGNMKWADYSRTVGIFASKMSQAHVSFAEGNAALALFTNTGESAQLAATHLGMLFLKMANDVNTLATHAKKLHLSFDTTAFKSMNLAQKIAYLDQITGHDPGKIRAILGNQSMTTTYEKLLHHMGDYKTGLDAISHSHGSLASSFSTASSGFNAAMGRMKAAGEVLLITIGQQLLPIIQNLVQQVTPLITQFTNWLVKSGALKNAVAFLGNVLGGLITGLINTVKFFRDNEVAMAALKATLIVVAVVIGVMMVMALYSMAAAAVVAMLPFLPLIAVIVGVIVVVTLIILAVQHWGQIAHWLQGVWGAILGWLKGVWGAFSGWFMGLLGSIGSFFVGLWAKIVSATQAAWQWIINAVKIGAMILLAIIFAPIIAIVALFLWLYNHNYYFKALIDAIVRVVKAGLAWLTNAFHVALNWIVGLFTWLHNMAVVYWTLLSMTIRIKILQAEAWIRSIWNKVVSYLAGIWQSISQKVGEMWTTISNFFKNAWASYVQAPLQNLWNSLVSFFNGWPKQALQWGINLIQGFIDGIKSMFGNVTGTVGNLMSNVAKFMGFHSPAQAGPGRELNLWGPNLVKGFATGILNAKPVLQNALNTLMIPVGTTLSGGGGGSTGAAASGPMMFNLTVHAGSADAYEVAKQVKNELADFYRHATNVGAGRYS